MEGNIQIGWTNKTVKNYTLVPVFKEDVKPFKEEVKEEDVKPFKEEVVKPFNKSYE